MKKWIKLSLKALWRRTFPLRRPIAVLLSAFIARSVVIPSHHCHVSEETGLVMDHMVRELVRLQKQIEHLQRTVNEQGQAHVEPSPLTVVGGEPQRRSVAG